MSFDALYGNMLGKEAALWDFPELGVKALKGSGSLIALPMSHKADRPQTGLRCAEEF